MTSPEGQESAFPSWLDSPAGERVWTWCEEVVGRFVTDVFGFYAIQLGLPQRDLFRSREEIEAEAYARQGRKIAYRRPTA